MEFTVITGKDGRVECVFADGRLTDSDGQFVFTDRTFADAMDADMFLLTDDFAQFMGAFIAAPYWRNMSNPMFNKLVNQALADVESGVKHACRTTEHCQSCSGCPVCFRAVMTSHDIGISQVDVYEEGIIKLTMSPGCGQPTSCTVSFRNVPIQLHKREPQCQNESI